MREKLKPLLRKRLEEHANEEWQCSGAKTWPMEVIPERVESTGGFAYPALVDEGQSVGVQAFHQAEQARQSHRAGCVRLLMLAQPDQVAYLTKKFPLGLAARVELPRIGAGGTKLEALLQLAAEGALACLPRSAEEFSRAAEKARGDWHAAAVPVGKALDAIVSQVPPLLDWCERQRGSKFLAAVAEDIEEQLQWMLREQFAWRAGHAALCDYPRHLQAIQMRIDRLQSLPIQKDLEKMERVRELWEPWFDAWKREPQRCELWPIGWMLLEYRVSLFAPNVPVKGSISEKKIRMAWEGMVGF